MFTSCAIRELRPLPDFHRIALTFPNGGELVKGRDCTILFEDLELSLKYLMDKLVLDKR